MPDQSARLLEFLRERAIAPQAQWCHDLPDGFDHWPSTLRQRVQVTERGAGGLHLVAVSDCVRGVADAELAQELCAHLTSMAGGWAFVHDPVAAVVVASIIGVVAADDEASLTCWLDAAVMSAWHAWTVADPLARAIGGQPAVTAPAGTQSPREDVDGLLRLPEALRSRPEWVFDPAQLRLLALPQLADRLADEAAPPMHVQRADHEGCVLWVRREGDDAPALSWPSALVIEVVERPGIGYGLLVRAGGECDDPINLAREFARLTLTGEMDVAPGVWSADVDGLWFGVFAAEFTVARLTRDDDGSLAGVAALSAAVWQSAAGVAPLVAARGASAGAPAGPLRESGDAGPLADTAAARALSIQASTWQPALVAVGQALRGLGPTGSDGRLLWLPGADGETVTHLATWGRLDPPGPALSTLLLVGGSAVQAQLLVLLDRHPTTPRHHVCAVIGEGGSLTRAVYDVARSELRYLPGFVDQTDAPESLRDAAAAGLVAGVRAALVDGRPEGAGPAAEAAAEWWAAAADQENVLQHYLALPAAWDAALDDDQRAGAQRQSR